MTDETKGLVWIFPRQDINKTMMDVFKNREPDEDTFIGQCGEVIIIDLDKCVMYVADPDDPKIIRLKEIEV